MHKNLGDSDKPNDLGDEDKVDDLVAFCRMVRAIESQLDVRTLSNPFM